MEAVIDLGIMLLYGLFCAVLGYNQGFKEGRTDALDEQVSRVPYDAQAHG